MRIGKCECGGEFVAISIFDDKIIEIQCKNCKKNIILKNPIIPKWKRQLIVKFEKEINGGKK